ncbi:TetR/AcrR family transcriptional regulator [Acidocella aminolytica]|nr:TetR/AcrR family transcriptional regulator [Acidocella aminolytica]
MLNPEEGLKRVIQATEAILVKQELDTHSMAAIAREASMSKRTLYSLVKSKEALIELVIKHIRTYATDLLDGPVEGPEQAVAILEEFLYRWANAALSPIAINIVRMAMDERRTLPSIAKTHFESGSEFFVRRLSAWLTQQAEQGYLMVQAPLFVSELIWAGLIGRHMFFVALGYKKAPSRGKLKHNIQVILPMCNIKMPL